MNATEELRRLLDERGVGWAVPDESWNQDSITYWKVGSIKWVAFESENGTFWLNCNSVTDLTPEQAIAATVGRETCHMVKRHDYVVYGEAPCIWSECDECGGVLPDSFGIAVSYCPNCGRRVVE